MERVTPINKLFTAQLGACLQRATIAEETSLVPISSEYELSGATKPVDLAFSKSRASKDIFKDIFKRHGLKYHRYTYAKKLGWIDEIK